MEALIVAIIGIGLLAGVASFLQSPTYRHMQYEAEQQEEAEITVQKAAAFCDMILSNSAIVAMAKDVASKVESELVISVMAAKKNKVDFIFSLCFSSCGVHGVETVRYINPEGQLGLYTKLHNPPLFDYSKYGIQAVEGDYKIYGLAQAVGKIIIHQLQQPKTLDIETLSTNLKVSAIPADSLSLKLPAKAEMEIFWSVKQNKFVEL